MKAIINGKRYDTETATLVYEWTNGNFTNDFRYREKELYRTKAGAWFIKHGGGPLTDMARSCGNNSLGWGSSIEPVSPKDAFEFLVSHGGEEEAEEYFPEMIQEA